jgi:hypothetical protein
VDLALAQCSVKEKYRRWIKEGFKKDHNTHTHTHTNENLSTDLMLIEPDDYKILYNKTNYLHYFRKFILA